MVSIRRTRNGRALQARSLLAALALASAPAWAQDAQVPPAPTGSTIEDDITAGRAPPGLAPPPADRKILEGDWYPFFRGGMGGPPPGPPPGGGKPPPRTGVLDNDENAPWSFQQCSPQPVFFGGMGVAIVQNATTVLIVNEEVQNYRVVFVDAEHPKTFTPSRNGHSIGRWEGDTLVVDTVGLTRQGGALTDAHIVERISRTDDGTVLSNTMTVTENGKSSTRTSTWRWRPDIKINESVCEEGYAQFELKNGKLEIVEGEAGQ